VLGFSSGAPPWFSPSVGYQQVQSKIVSSPVSHQSPRTFWYQLRHHASDTGSGSRKETSLAMDDVVQRFDPLEELVRVVTGDPLEELVRDVKAQQTALGVPHPP
jgi:hypothetical protein